LAPTNVRSSRRVLLDALDALGEHKGATILVGAQAIYLHTGDADLAGTTPAEAARGMAHLTKLVG